MTTNCDELIEKIEGAETREEIEAVWRATWPNLWGGGQRQVMFVWWGWRKSGDRRSLRTLVERIVFENDQMESNREASRDD